MKLNIAYPAGGTMKVIEVDDEKKLASFYDKRMGYEVEGEVLGEEYKGYLFRITGGNDKQGFPMQQGILINGRVRLLMSKGSCYYRPRRQGERKRKSVRGCIVGHDIALLNLTVVRVGDTPIPGLTDPESARPRRLGPKRANNIRKLFQLSKEDDVRKYVIAREFTTKSGKTVQKRPKIQRLITPVVLQRKRHRAALKTAAREKAQKARAEYNQLHAQRVKERRASSLARRRSSARKSSKKEAGAAR